MKIAIYNKLAIIPVLSALHQIKIALNATQLIKELFKAIPANAMMEFMTMGFQNFAKVILFY
jgi:hypothetical protein